MTKPASQWKDEWRLLSPLLDLLGSDPPGQQASNLVERQQARTILDQPLKEAVALGPGGGDHDHQAARRVAQAVRRGQHAAVDRQVGRASGCAVGAGPI